MKIHLVSDLHCEFAPYPFKQPEGTDVVIAAGDIAVGDGGPMCLRDSFGKDVPVIYVAGNHEYYKQGLKENREAIKRQAKIHNVHFLDNDSVVIDGVTFLGGTLWTNYLLHGEEHRDLCKQVAKDSMNDFRLISAQKNPWVRFTPDQAEQEFNKTYNYITNRLEMNKQLGIKTVVVTHMAPSAKSINPVYSNEKNKWVNASYASHLEELMIRYEPTLWVHGHMHDNADYTVGKTRVVCNPRGYSHLLYPEEQENKGFIKDLIIEI